MSNAICYLLAAIIIAASTVTTHFIRTDYQDYLDESRCVAKYIKLGIERRDIVTDHGTCWLKDSERSALSEP